MRVLDKIELLSWVFVPLLALYGAFKLYGLFGFILVLSYMLIIFISIYLFFDSKRRAIAPKSFDDKEQTKYNKEVAAIDLKELRAMVFLLFMPISFVVIVYLYFQVEYGVLYALLYILFYAYKTQLNLEIINAVHNQKEYYPRTADGSSMDNLEERIEILNKRLDELYDLSGFDSVKLFEIKSEKKRVAIIHKLWDIDLEHNWIDKLWQWANQHEIDTDIIPRGKDELLRHISYGIIHSDFHNKNIDTIPPEIGYLNTCTYLDFSMNNLSVLPENIVNINDLEDLNLRLNELKSIPLELGNLENLRSLDISSNRLINLPVEITNIPYLEELILHNNPIKSLPDELYTLKYLTKVTVDSTVEVSSMLKDSLGDRLKIIDIGWMQGLWDWADTYKLDENIIPRNKTSLLNLETLKISPYDIAYVLSTSTLPSGHTHINIREDSDITKLPKEIGNLINLKELSIDNTRIARLPKEIGGLGNLEVLSIDNTNITELPIEIENLKNLKKLLMRNTKITTLPTEIQDLKNLKIWSVDRNS